MLYLTLLSCPSHRLLHFQQMHVEQSEHTPTSEVQDELAFCVAPALPTKTAALCYKTRTPMKEEGKV